MTGVAVALGLVAVAVVVSRVKRLELESELVVATVRALVQLGVVALIVTAVFEELALSALFLVVMLLAAAWTTGRRLERIPNRYRLAGIAIFSGSSIALIVLFAGRAFPLEPRWLIPIAGMLIGNSMTTASVAGTRVRDELTDKTLEVEARLALGVGVNEALTPYMKRAIKTSMIPIIDTTKNVGLIHLPGAFVGMLLGGATPADAAKVQLIVLFMLLGAVAVAGMTTTLLVGRSFVGPGERLVVPPATTAS